MGFDSKFLGPLRARVANMVARAVLNLIDDSKKMQVVQIQLEADGEARDAERFQNYGFTGVPLQGAEAAVIFVGGRRDHALAIAVDDRRYRLQNLASGEVAVYDHNGSNVILKANGDILVNPNSGRVVLNGTDVELGQPAVNPIAKGDTLNTAIETLGTAIASAMGAITTGAPAGGAPAGAAITTAVAAFTTAAAAALSTKAKVG